MERGQQDVKEPRGFGEQDRDEWSLPGPPLVPAGPVSEVWPVKQASEQSVERRREPAT